MIGIEGATNLLIARLELEMPSKVVELKARLGDAGVSLRPPAAYTDYLAARVEVAQYPIIMVAPRNDANSTFLDEESGYGMWQIDYRVRIYLVERGNGFEQVELRRRRLTLGLREVLTSNPGLSDDPAAWVARNSLSSAYFGIGQVADGDNRSIAGTTTDLTVTVQEMTEPWQPSTATADDIIVTVSPLEPPA